MTWIVLIAFVAGAFLTRNDWLAAFHHMTAPGGTPSASPQPARPCPSAVAASIPGGGNSTEIAAYKSPEFKVTLCMTTAGEIYYHGADRKNPKLWTTLPAKRSRHGFKAHADGYEYYVTKHRLVVTKNGVKVLDQPLHAAK